jgi:two-component system NtrC family sensor kinase
MESQGLSTLTEDHWLAIEKVSDILAEGSASTGDLQQALSRSLEMILVTLKRADSGAALFLPRFCEHIHNDWTFLNMPPEGQTSLLNGQSPLFASIKEAIQTNMVWPGSKETGLGAIFPLVGSEKPIGALLVSGEIIPPEQYSRWQALLRPVSRMVTMHALVSGNINGTPSYLELLRSRNTLRAMFDSLPIAIYIIDPSYTLVAINQSRAERINVKPNQLVGSKCYERLFQRSSPCPACRISETFASGQNTTRMNRSWLDNERFIEWEVSTFPIMDENDAVAQTIIVEQDITDKRNLEANLIQSEKLAAVGQLAAGVAHEINNPLTAIIANAQILHREISPNEEDLIDSVKLIEMAGTRASQVVRNLLGIARKEKYEFSPVDLNETLHNALTLVQHELVGRPMQVNLDLQDKMPRAVASQDQLQGVWINLILNAIDAIDKEAGEISISTRFTGTEFQVTFKDNGKGISEDHLSKVFEPFFTTKSPGRGTGLGLSVCMRVIRHHGGNILVESQAGQWTRFTVSLPGPK